MSLVLPLFGDDTRVEQDIDEVGTTNQNILDLIKRSNEDASSEMQSVFEGNVDFTGNLPDDLPDFFRQLVIELQTAYFWVKSNNDEAANTIIEGVRAKAKLTLEKRFAPALSTI